MIKRKLVKNPTGYGLYVNGYGADCAFRCDLDVCGSCCPHFDLAKGKGLRNSDNGSGVIGRRETDVSDGDVWYQVKLYCVNPPRIFRFDKIEVAQ